MEVPLNNDQVQRISGKILTLIPNTDMSNYSNILDLFATNYVLINYLINENYGHWVGLHLDKNNSKITYFDSYGKMPDEARKYIPMKYRVESNQEYPHLLKLMDDWTSKGGEVHYNNEQLQMYSKDIQTCGRWVGYYFRWCDEVTVEEFEEIFRNNALDKIEEENLKGLSRELVMDESIVDLTNKFL